MASSPAACSPRGAWAEKNTHTHGVDSGSSRVAAEEDSASNKALEVKGSSTRELSGGGCSLHAMAQERASHPPVPIPRGGEKKRGTRGKEEGTSKYPLAVESSVGPHPGAGG